MILAVAQQVAILFILIAIGFLLGKVNILDDRGAKALSDIALLLSTPCVIIRSFERQVTAEELTGLLIAFGASFGVHLVGIIIGKVAFLHNTSRDNTLWLAVVLCNAGFMGLPLQEAILGDIGVFYGATYVVVFNLVLWSFGQRVMGGKMSPWRLLVNPGTIGLLLGLAVMFFCPNLPEIVAKPVDYLAALNTPLPMLFIGYTLSKSNLGKAVRAPANWVSVVLRLLVVPAAAVGILYLSGVRGDLLVSMGIAVSAPVAASVSMFASRYRQDTEAAVSTTALSTLLSLVTMPLVIALTRLIA